MIYVDEPMSERVQYNINLATLINFSYINSVHNNVYSTINHYNISGVQQYQNPLLLIKLIK